MRRMKSYPTSCLTRRISRWANGGRTTSNYDQSRTPRVFKPSSRMLEQELTGEALFGLHSIYPAMTGAHRTIHELLVQETKATTNASQSTELFDQILKLAAEKSIPIRHETKQRMNQLVDNKPHQGLILDVSEIDLTQTKGFRPSEFNTPAPVLLALDEIHDPQNLGAILRSAYFLGCHGVMFSPKNMAPLSPTVSRASAGACEVMTDQNMLYHVTPHLPRVLETCRKQGWHVLGACSEGTMSSRRPRVPDVEARRPTILVMGNEHRGLRTNVRKSCDGFISIPSHRMDKSSVDSLNVSVATGILLHQLLS